MNKRLAPWAHTGLVIGLSAGGFLGLRLWVDTGLSAYLNTANLGALSGYLLGLGAGMLFLESRKLYMQQKEGQSYG
jgi:hypothetical protein